MGFIANAIYLLVVCPTFIAELMMTFLTYFTSQFEVATTLTTTYKSYDRSPRFSECVSCNLDKAVQFQKAAFWMLLLARHALYR